MTINEIGQEGDRIFNNADSFAMEFDLAWKKKFKESKISEQDIEIKLKEVLLEVKEHPFIKNNQAEAKEIGRFRIRLLNLK